MDLSMEAQRNWFVGLAIAAGVALLVAALVVAFAPSSAFGWLLAALVVLVLVVAAEVALLVLTRRARAG